MRIGLTYDLRADYLTAGYGEEETAEFDQIDTVIALEHAIERLGYSTDRIGSATRLVERLAAGDRWDLVFNLAVALDKRLTKIVVRNTGLSTPDFALVASLADIDAVDLSYPLFAKPVAEGTSKGVTPKSKIADRRELREACCELLKKYDQGVLVEAYLPGREFTVGLLGTGTDAFAVGTVEIVLRRDAEAGIYSYHNKEHYDQLVEYRLVNAAVDEQARQAEELALRAWRVLGCRDGGRIDVRCDAAGAPSFIEVNPLAGMHPVRSDLPILCGKVGISYDALVERIIVSALRRVNRPAGNLAAASR